MKNTTRNNIQEQVNLLVKNAENIWIPRWFDLFSNPHSGFHERLDQSGTPIDLPRRLVSQCRQIIVYSLASNDAYTGKLNDAFDFIKQHYFIPETGGSVFSLNTENKIHDHTYDLYAHAFVLLACAQYYKATKNEEALSYAKTTLNFIKDHFALHIGYAESLDSDLVPLRTIRRQNPHMHLLEGCIFMYGVTKDNTYKDVADTLVSLFLNKFFNTEKGVLHEFFDENLNVHPQEGHKIEAGHHGEWIWLLTNYKNIFGQQSNAIDSSIDDLFAFVVKYGVDFQKGGVINSHDSETNTVIDSNKRIWTCFEIFRAASIMYGYAEHKENAEKIMLLLLNNIHNDYINIKTGRWKEILDKGMKSVTDFLPATTPYHIYPILKEIKKYILPI